MFIKDGTFTEAEKQEIIKSLENRDNFTLSEPITQEIIDFRKKQLQEEHDNNVY